MLPFILKGNGDVLVNAEKTVKPKRKIKPFAFHKCWCRYCLFFLELNVYLNRPSGF